MFACRGGREWRGRSGCIADRSVERLEAVDDAQQVEPDRRVHVNDALASVGCGCGDQLVGSLELVAVLGEELAGGEEVGAGQAGVRVRALLLERQAAVPVGSVCFARARFSFAHAASLSGPSGSRWMTSPRMLIRSW